MSVRVRVRERESESKREPAGKKANNDMETAVP